MATNPSDIQHGIPPVKTGEVEHRIAVGTEEISPRVFLQPITPPSILGLFGFAGATFMVAAHLAGWFGTAQGVFYLFPFVAFFGGLAQFLAGMWSYKARDGVATAMHGTWGAFWMAYGLLYFLGLRGVVNIPTGPLFPELGLWFIILAVTTWAGFWASLAENLGLALVLFFLALGSTLGAIGFILGLHYVIVGAGWSFIVSALVAWYTATALMVNSAFGREVISLGKFSHAEEKPCVSAGVCEPGVMHGQ